LNTPPFSKCKTSIRCIYFNIYCNPVYIEIKTCGNYHILSVCRY